MTRTFPRIEPSINPGAVQFAAQMVIDSVGANWYSGASLPGPTQNDLLSVAAHEFGHMSGSALSGDGKGHFPEDDVACPVGLDRNTMCPTIYTGTIDQRTLATHDAHEFDEAY